jgi:capsular polysaccharide biosynthesis protein
MGAGGLAEKTAGLVQRTGETFLVDRRLPVLTRGELRQYAADHGRIWYGESETPCHIRGSTQGGIPHEFERFVGHYHPDRRFICEIPNGRLIGPSAVGVLNTGEVIPETAGANADYFRFHIDRNLGRRKKYELLLERISPRSSSVSVFDRSCIFPLVPFYRNYYYPWLVEYLPKLRALERYEAKTGITPTILIEPNAPSFVTETLSLLGYDDQYDTWDEMEWNVKRLLITNHRLNTSWAGRRYGFHPSYDDLTWVRENIRSSIGEASDHRSSDRKIHISRQETDRGRRVKNYHELTDFLQAQGFESYVFESYSFTEQVRLISNADVILSPHGAGLSNMLFADDPTIIELFAETRVQPSYYFLAETLGFEYEGIVTEASSHDPHDDLIVDIDELRKRLDETLPSPI